MTPTIKIIPRNLEAYGEAFQLTHPISDSTKELLRVHGYGISTTRAPLCCHALIYSQNTDTEFGVSFNDWVVLVDNEVTTYASYEDMLEDFSLYEEMDFDSMKAELQQLKIEKITDKLHAKYNLKLDDFKAEDAIEIRNKMREILSLMGY